MFFWLVDCIFFILFGTGRDRAVMNTSVTQCRVRQCSSCLGETEFFCIPCLCDLCLECKGNHANNLNTFDHNVVIFCEKLKYISKQNSDAKNTDRGHEINNTDEESANSSNYTKYDNVLSDGTYLKNRREQLREIIRNITQALFYRCVLLKAMTYDV